LFEIWGNGKGILPALPLPSATGLVGGLFREEGKSLPNSAQPMRADTLSRRNKNPVLCLESQALTR
jgi:hypothetical protein